MNKKLIIFFIAIGIIVIGGIIGISTHTNKPEYVMKKYVQLINNGEFDKLKKYEYNYEEYKIASSIDTYIDEGISMESIQKSAYIEDYQLNENSMSIQQCTGDLCISLMNINVGDNYKKISKILMYNIHPGFSSLNQTNGGLSCIVLGKVHGRWKVVYSPYYYLQ